MYVLSVSPLIPGLQLVGLPGHPPTMKNHMVFDVFHKMHLKRHFLTCNFLMCLLHFWLQMSDFLMGLLHFCFLFFLGCPDGLQQRFSTILVALWEPLGPSWAVLGRRLGFLGGSWKPPRSPLGLTFDALFVSWHLLRALWGFKSALSWRSSG